MTFLTTILDKLTLTKLTATFLKISIHLQNLIHGKKHFCYYFLLFHSFQKSNTILFYLFSCPRFLFKFDLKVYLSENMTAQINVNNTNK